MSNKTTENETTVGRLECCSPGEGWSPPSVKWSNLNHNIPIARNLILAGWVSDSLQEKAGNFVRSQDLYKQYQAVVPEHSQVSAGLFKKDIEPLLLALGFRVGKGRSNEGRGYVGITFKHHDLKDGGDKESQME